MRQFSKIHVRVARTKPNESSILQTTGKSVFRLTVHASEPSNDLCAPELINAARQRLILCSSHYRIPIEVALCSLSNRCRYKFHSRRIGRSAGVRHPASARMSRQCSASNLWSQNGLRSSAKREMHKLHRIIRSLALLLAPTLGLERVANETKCRCRDTSASCQEAPPPREYVSTNKRCAAKRASQSKAEHKNVLHTV